MTTLSLRSRLLLATVTLVTLGLFVADGATFGILRASLLGRIDQQLSDARGFATRGLFDQGGGFSGGPGGGPSGRSAFAVTYAALLDPSGAILVERSFGFGIAGAPPKLPPGLPGSASHGDGAATSLFTADSQGSSARYRVLATALADGQGTVVVAYPLGDMVATLRRLLLVEGIVTASVLGAVAALAWWLVRLGLRPLTHMEHVAGEIADGDLTRRVEPAEPRTEVGRLGLALNVMLERIEAAFAERQASENRLRRFVADASHELRTPLTSIRGYAELFRRGADARPEDLAKSMQRIEDESARMGTLVEELLLLARLDQGPRLERGSVDLTIVAEDAVADALAVQPERPIDIECPASVIVDGDEARLRQVAANLLSNALGHTPAGTAVHVRVRTEGRQAILEVADEGPGLEEDHAARVFDRFFRVDPARARDHGGVGLGLSIVAAIVQAHGGKVGLETSPGGGARFIVTLPLAIDSHLDRSEATGSSEVADVQ